MRIPQLDPPNPMCPRKKTHTLSIRLFVTQRDALLSRMLDNIEALHHTRLDDDVEPLLEVSPPFDMWNAFLRLTPP